MLSDQYQLRATRHRLDNHRIHHDDGVAPEDIRKNRFHDAAPHGRMTIHLFLIVQSEVQASQRPSKMTDQRFNLLLTSAAQVTSHKHYPPINDVKVHKWHAGYDEIHFRRIYQHAVDVVRGVYDPATINWPWFKFFDRQRVVPILVVRTVFHISDSELGSLR